MSKALWDKSSPRCLCTNLKCPSWSPSLCAGTPGPPCTDGSDACLMVAGLTFAILITQVKLTCWVHLWSLCGFTYLQNPKPQSATQYGREKLSSCASSKHASGLSEKPPPNQGKEHAHSQTIMSVGRAAVGHKGACAVMASASSYACIYVFQWEGMCVLLKSKSCLGTPGRRDDYMQSWIPVI